MWKTFRLWGSQCLKGRGDFAPNGLHLGGRCVGVGGSDRCVGIQALHLFGRCERFDGWGCRMLNLLGKGKPPLFGEAW